MFEHKNGIKLVCTDNYKRRCYFILIDFMVDYKKQVFIINIKANMQCLICHILPKKKKLVASCRSRKLTNQLGLSLNINATTRQFSRIKLQIAGYMNKNTLHGTTSMLISMSSFCQILCTNYIKAL